MKKTCLLWLLAFTCIGTLSLFAQEVNPTPNIAVNANGKASAKPDIAFVIMTVRSTSPLAADALDQNNKKVEDVKVRLAALGYKDAQMKFTGNRFAPSGGGIYYPGGQRPTGFDVYNNFFVFIEGPDLNDVTQFNKRVSALLDELSKAGASPSNTPISNISMGGASVVGFAVKDPAPYEKQATFEALGKARPLAEEVARHMKVQITGITWSTATPSPRAAMNMQVSPLDELPYDYVSSSMDEVAVRVRVDVRYAYK
jgi:uncharacterized protein YggE